MNRAQRIAVYAVTFIAIWIGFFGYYRQIARTPARNASYVCELDLNTYLLHSNALRAASCDAAISLSVSCTTFPRKMTKSEKEANALLVVSLRQQVEAEGETIRHYCGVGG